MARGSGQGVVLGYLKYVLGFDSLAFDQGVGDAEKRLKAAQRSLQKTADKFTGIGQKMTLGLTLPLGAFAASSFNAATDAAELQSAFEQTFGNMSGAMNKWAEETGNALGRSTQEMQKAANTFGIFFNTAVPRDKAAEMSKTFAQLAQDLGSFYNVDTETAIGKLRSGLSGESEPLRDFGVFLTEASVQAKALELGLAGVGNELTEQEKIIARYQLVLEQTTNAQGDIARTSGGTANQIRSAQAAFEELRVEVGTKLLPLLTPLIEKLASALNWFTQLSPEVRNTALVVGGLAAVLGPAAIGIGAILSAFSNLLPLIGAGGSIRVGLAAMTATLGGPVGMAALAAAVVVAFANWEKIGPWVDGVAERTKKAAGEIDGFLAKVNAKIDETDRALGTGTRAELFESWGESARKAWQDINSYDLAVWAQGIDAEIASAYRSFGQFWQGVQAGFNNLRERAVAAMQALYNGVKAWLGDKLRGLVPGVVKAVADMVTPFRDAYIAVVGNSYIPDMVDEIGQHMRRLDQEMVKPAKDAATEAAKAFRDLQFEAQGILARIFPEQERSNTLARELEAITQYAEQAKWSVEQLEEARRRLFQEYGTDTTGEKGDVASILGDVDPSVLVEGIPTASEIIKSEWEAVEAANDNLARNFATLARDVTASLDGLIGNIKSGDWLSAMTGLLDLIDQIGGIFAGATGGAPRVFNIGGARALGGPVSAGTSYLVGENGPELFTARRSGYIHPNAANDGSGRGGVMEVRLRDPMLEARIVAGSARVVQANEASNARAAGRRFVG